jgi:hypothetical protein
MSDYPSFSEPPSSYEPSVPNSTMAIVSLIAGILGLTFLPLIGSIVAIFAGSSAQKEIEDSGGMIGGEGLAKVGIITGWVGIGFGVLGCCIAVVVILFSFGIFGIAAQEMSTLLSFVL